MNPGTAAFLAPPSSTSRAGMAALILAGHVLILVATISVGSAVLEVVRPALTVNLLPEPPRARQLLRPPPVPMPHLLKPEILIPEPPRFETLATVQRVEQPEPPTAPAQVPVAAVVSSTPAPAVVEPPRHDLAYLDNPAPSYPVFAKRAGEQGKVILRVHVDAAGQVAGIELHRSSGFERLDKAALAAVRQWRFAPARSGDRAVPGVALVPITFSLGG